MFHGRPSRPLTAPRFDRTVLVTPHGKRIGDLPAAARGSSVRHAALADRRVRGGQLDHGRHRLRLRRQPPGAARRGADRGAAGFVIAVAISHRVVGLARAAGEMAKGSFDAPLNTSGLDEIGDLARSLDAMRASLQVSFGVLTADRNKLAAIFDGLTDAVIVTDYEGPVRFSNSAAARMLGPTGEPPDVIEPQLRRAAEVGFAAHPALRIGDRAYAMTARALPDERAVLAVLRDRTDELRRELAEADFISNAAHELRNPLAGMSGAIEVLQRGAKNNPLDRDHFLNRLADDAERMKALTASLLTLARVESRGAAENEVVDVAIAVRDVVAAVDPPPRIELVVDVEQDLAATGDPTLLRQVMIGLLTNAFKNTPPPGTVTLRGSPPGRRRGRASRWSTPGPASPGRRSSASSSASTGAASRASRRASASAWRSRGAWST